MANSNAVASNVLNMDLIDRFISIPFGDGSVCGVNCSAAVAGECWWFGIAALYRTAHVAVGFGVAQKVSKYKKVLRMARAETNKAPSSIFPVTFVMATNHTAQIHERHRAQSGKRSAKPGRPAGANHHGCFTAAQTGRCGVCEFSLA